jgi:histidinol phosphatase-like PHP family hydrolase
VLLVYMLAYFRPFVNAYFPFPSLEDHWSQIQICQQRYPELTIRLGLEMDYYEGREDDIAATILRYEDLIGQIYCSLYLSEASARR